VDERPLWRRAFDAVDADLGPRLEQFVRSDQFAEGKALMNRLNRQAFKAAQDFNRQALHFWNRPAATDVADLKKQIAALERQVQRMSKQLRENARGDD
jgi:hypothetical protein